MSLFTDAAGQEWQLEFDGFLLGRIEKEANIDLAVVSAGGLLAVERDAKALIRVLAVACDEQLKARRRSADEFQKQIRKEAITRARKAVMEALADFFPENEWSAMLSSLTTQKTRADQMKELEAVAPAFMALPEEMKMQLFQEEIAKGGSSPLSPGDVSASDQDGTPSMPADDLPESAESVPEGSPSETSG